jgi:hypothetical protein
MSTNPQSRSQAQTAASAVVVADVGFGIVLSYFHPSRAMQMRVASEVIAVFFSSRCNAQADSVIAMRRSSVGAPGGEARMRDSIGASCSLGTAGVSGTNRTPLRPARRDQGDTPGRPQQSGPRRQRERMAAPVFSPHARTLRSPCPPAGHAPPRCPAEPACRPAPPARRGAGRPPHRDDRPARSAGRRGY